VLETGSLGLGFTEGKDGFERRFFENLSFEVDFISAKADVEETFKIIRALKNQKLGGKTVKKGRKRLPA
jgi:hypothetical protein